MIEWFDLIVDVCWVVSCTPFLGWLNGDGSVGQPMVMALIPPFGRRPKGSDDFGQK